eukprot:UN07307
MDTATSFVDHLREIHLIPPIIVSIGYWVSIQIFQPSKSKQEETLLLRKKANKSKKQSFEPSLLNIFVFIHNMLLCFFSVLCFVNTFGVLFSLLYNNGLYDGACRIKDAYETTSYGYWSYLFMLSKYYEVIDTYIVILKGRRPINLQVYHHIGAMIGCAWFHFDSSVGSVIFIVPNAFVHSIMYLYYALSVLRIRVPFKSLITTMQMIQFLAGLCCIIYVVTMLYPVCITSNERLCWIYHF